jgi:hypothetical protein
VPDAYRQAQVPGRRRSHLEGLPDFAFGVIARHSCRVGEARCASTPKITPIAARPRLIGVVGVIARFAGSAGKAKHRRGRVILGVVGVVTGVDR